MLFITKFARINRIDYTTAILGVARLDMDVRTAHNKSLFDHSTNHLKFLRTWSSYLLLLCYNAKASLISDRDVIVYTRNIDIVYRIYRVCCIYVHRRNIINIQNHILLKSNSSFISTVYKFVKLSSLFKVT